MPKSDVTINGVPVKVVFRQPSGTMDIMVRPTAAGDLTASHLQLYRGRVAYGHLDFFRGQDKVGSYRGDRLGFGTFVAERGGTNVATSGASSASAFPLDGRIRRVDTSAAHGSMQVRTDQRGSVGYFLLRPDQSDVERCSGTTRIS